MSLVVLDSTYEVNRIEVCSLCEHFHILLVVLVYLTALKNLKAYCTILIVGKERTATGFANILNHTTHAHRTVELLSEIKNEVGILKFLDVRLAAAKLMLYETDYLLQLVMVVGT